ncbi:unnamed protein product, partial [Iphiclides podalirius]
MPKKKTGQRKKAEKQKQRQKEIRNAKDHVDIAQHPCNMPMECDKCQKKQKSRAFCYFCQALQRLPACAHCGKALAWWVQYVIFARHGCAMGASVLIRMPAHVHLRMPFVLSVNVVYGNMVGAYFAAVSVRVFYVKMTSLNTRLRAKCWSRKHINANRATGLGQYSCLRCKTCFCEEHVRRRGTKLDRRAAPPCPRCGFALLLTGELSMSTRSHRYGRQGAALADDDDYNAGGYTGYDGGTEGGDYSYSCSDSEEEDEDDEEEEDDSEEESDEDAQRESSSSKPSA